MSVTNPKTTLFVGGLVEQVTTQVLQAAFNPFGDIVRIQLALNQDNKHRGFAFVEYELQEDAKAALENMHLSELMGHLIKVSMARQGKYEEMQTKAVWDDIDFRSTMIDELSKKAISEIQGKTMMQDEDEEGLPESKKPRMLNPRVFLDIRVNDKPIGRVILILRADICPKTAENFRALCTGERGYGYKGTRFHRIIPAFMIQGGDFTKGDGTGGRSIWGGMFDDENFTMKHSRAGLLSMANSGPNTNGSQFFITAQACSWLDGKHVVFGEVTSGLDVVKKMEQFGTSAGNTLKKVTIHDCGEL